MAKWQNVSMCELYKHMVLGSNPAEKKKTPVNGVE
jgi:hypothetical protein